MLPRKRGWGGAGGREGEEVKREPAGEEGRRGRGIGERGRRWETLEIMLLVTGDGLQDGGWW